MKMTIPFLVLGFVAAGISMLNLQESRAGKRDGDGPGIIMRMDDSERRLTRLENAMSKAVPVGTIVPFAGNDVPDGWLPCDGDWIDEGINPEYGELEKILNGAVGGKVGERVRLPDLTSRVALGREKTSAKVLGVGGSDTITLSQNQLPNITLNGTTDEELVPRPVQTFGPNGPDGPHQPYSFLHGNPPTGGWHAFQFDGPPVKHPVTVTLKGEGKTIDIRPKYVTVNFIIKYRQGF
jgi:microcystin-dependent protein